MNQLAGYIQQAIDEGREIDIVYHGGSQPGASRRIMPLMVIGNKVRARCTETNTAKLFMITKIELADKTMVNSTPNWTNGITFHEFTSMNEIYAAVKDTLIGAGWHVTFENDTIATHRSFKNGKPMKGCETALLYEEFTTDIMYDEDFNEISQTRRKQRPWTIRCKSGYSTAFKNPDKATYKFMEITKEKATALKLPAW